MKLLFRHITDRLASLYERGEAKSIALMLMADTWPEMSDVQLMLMEYDENKVHVLEPQLQRLMNGEPIQYVLGTSEFCGIRLHVEPGVLIPRPETTHLVELVVSHMPESQEISLLDIGTGSGCIALALKYSCSNALVEGWDVSEKALAIAKENAEQLGLDVQFQCVDILNKESWEDCSSLYDAIVSNPPYITRSEQKDMERNVLDFEPHIALFVPDEDPLVFYRAISNFAKSHLKSGGLIAFEINQHLGIETAKLIEEIGFRNVELSTDMFLNHRYVTATWK